jgi:hypothetical protein
LPEQGAQPGRYDHPPHYLGKHRIGFLVNGKETAEAALTLPPDHQ